MKLELARKDKSRYKPWKPYLGPTPEQRSRRVFLASLIWRLRRVLRDAVGAGLDVELAEMLNTLARNRRQIERAVVVWVDLIEIVVQTLEESYGRASGRGEIKQLEAKAILRHLLREGRFRLPVLPDYLQPVVIEVVVELSIRALVQAINDNSLWTSTNERPASAGHRLTYLLRWLQVVTRPLWEPVVRFAVRVWVWLRSRVPLSPTARAAVERVREEGLVDDPNVVLSAVSRVVVWIGRHGDQVVAAFTVVFDVVQEAEQFREMSGPEKRAYATDLVWAVLDDIGVDVGDGLLYAIVDAIIGGVIESAVHLFDKRQGFVTSRAA
jgi:hypothetical protein